MPKNFIKFFNTFWWSLINDFFDDNEVGFYKNVKDLGNKIEYLLKYPKKINEYGKRGKEKYFKLFNNKIITKKIIEKTF